MIIFNLQRFAEGAEPEVIIVPEGGEPEPEPIIEPEPLPPIAPRSNQGPDMPSSIAQAAWQNVEEMLVTLSNFVRVSMSEVRDQIQKVAEDNSALSEQLQGAIGRLNQNMAELNELIANATIEPDESQGDSPEGPKKRSRGGYLSRRGG